MNSELGARREPWLGTPRPIDDDGQSERQAWFAVFTRTRHEKKVVEHLRLRGVENFLPLYKSVRNWSHYRKVSLDLPLFPNYLFVKIARRQRTQTLEVPGVLSLVGQGGFPSPLREMEIEHLRTALQLRTVEPHPYLRAGVRVRIVAGVLAGMEGVVLRNKSGLRVIVTVESIRQSLAVEVNVDEIEPVRSQTAA